MYIVYAIYNKDNDKVYVGQTDDLTRRLELHNNKFFKNSFTSRYSGKWELIYKEEAANRSEAVKREKQLKSYQGRQFIKKYIPL